MIEAAGVGCWTGEDEARWRAAHCKLKAGAIVCDTCGEPADTIHFVPWVVVAEGQERRIEAACPRHDPGGYWLRVQDLTDNPLRCLAHLAGKRQAPHAQLVGWLGDAGGVALDRARR